MIASGAMLLRHLGERDRAAAIESAVGAVLERSDVRTPDLGGSATTEQVADAIASSATA
jgi:tartrate dehydrogenase/decarboxylase/D-malate dehydrogenase